MHPADQVDDADLPVLRLEQHVEQAEHGGTAGRQGKGQPAGRLSKSSPPGPAPLRAATSRMARSKASTTSPEATPPTILRIE